MATVKIVQRDKMTEVYIDGNPVQLKYLKRINLDMNAEKGNKFTLEYHVRDVEVETDDGTVVLKNDEE